MARRVIRMPDEPLSKNIRIDHECPCRTRKSHPRGRNFNQGPWLKFLPLGWDFPILHGHSWWIFFLPLLSGLFLFLLPVSGLFLGPMWDRNFSHGQTPISYRQRFFGELQVVNSSQVYQNKRYKSTLKAPSPSRLLLSQTLQYTVDFRYLDFAYLE